MKKRRVKKATVRSDAKVFALDAIARLRFKLQKALIMHVIKLEKADGEIQKSLSGGKTTEDQYCKMVLDIQKIHDKMIATCRTIDDYDVVHAHLSRAVPLTDEVRNSKLA